MPSDGASPLPSAYALGARIGGTAEGTSVHEAVHVASARRVAVKRIDLETQDRALAHVQAEVRTMAELAHDNLVALHSAFVSAADCAAPELWLVLPFYASGSCADVLRAARPNGFEEPVVLHIAREVAKGLDYLHSHGALHRNLKASNLLLGARQNHGPPQAACPCDDHPGLCVCVHACVWCAPAACTSCVR
jgi:serine/threonine protein kinase